jgi:hypothetical protein
MEEGLQLNRTEEIGNIRFVTPYNGKDREMVRIEPTGEFFVKGKFTTCDREVYEGLVSFLKVTGHMRTKPRWLVFLQRLDETLFRFAIPSFIGGLIIGGLAAFLSFFGFALALSDSLL